MIQTPSGTARLAFLASDPLTVSPSVHAQANEARAKTNVPLSIAPPELKMVTPMNVSQIII